MHCGYVLRCARIAAINLGLRGKYGWIVCGNTLSREVQFVYRIGSFFHEGPNGRRRGVIRDVAPEDCPILPELTHRTRQDLFEQVEPPPDSKQKEARPDILEVPQWALRLEQHLAALDDSERSQERPPIADKSPQEKGVAESRDELPPAEQGRLF